MLTGLCRLPVAVVPDPERLRPVDVPLVRGDAGRLRADTGWVPAVPLERTLADLLEHWRGRVAEAPAC